MAEYIEREALRNSVESIDWYSVYKGKLTAGAPNTENALYKANSIYAVIDNAPAADVVSVVRHAMWEEADWVEPDCHGFGIVRTPKAALRCSNCKNCFKKELLWKENYCPNCGAKMDGCDENGR